MKRYCICYTFEKRQCSLIPSVLSYHSCHHRISDFLPSHNEVPNLPNLTKRRMADCDADICRFCYDRQQRSDRLQSFYKSGHALHKQAYAQWAGQITDKRTRSKLSFSSVSFAMMPIHSHEYVQSSSLHAEHKRTAKAQQCVPKNWRFTYLISSPLLHNCKVSQENQNYMNPEVTHLFRRTRILRTQK